MNSIRRFWKNLECIDLSVPLSDEFPASRPGLPPFRKWVLNWFEDYREPNGEQVSLLHEHDLPAILTAIRQLTDARFVSPGHVTCRWIEPRSLPHGTTPNGNSGLRHSLVGYKLSRLGEDFHLSDRARPKAHWHRRLARPRSTSPRPRWPRHKARGGK